MRSRPTHRQGAASLSSLSGLSLGTSSLSGHSGVSFASSSHHSSFNSTGGPSQPNGYHRTGILSSPSIGSGMVHSPTMTAYGTGYGIDRSGSVRDARDGWSSSGGLAERARAVGLEAEDMQNKVFCKWLNARLEPQGYEPVRDLGKDFSDGTRLIQLVECLTEQSLGRFNREPNHRVQKFENAKQALERIKEMGVHLTNIGPEDIVDGNRKLILGMIWSLVLRFSIADISEEGSHAKEGLLLWCQRKTAPYESVDVQNFTRSFQDGLAFCALIHRHRPDLLDFDSLNKDLDHSAKNMKLAFEIADKHLNIPQLLDVEDVVGARKPDEKSIMTYVAQFFHAFSSTAQAETEARVISNFVENMSNLMIGVHEYEQRAQQLLDSIAERYREWATPITTQSFNELKRSRDRLLDYRATSRREAAAEKGQVANLLVNIQTKLKTYGLKSYTPPNDLKTEFIDERWHELLEAEAKRVREVTTKIHELQEKAKRKTADLANSLHKKLGGISAALASAIGPLVLQLETVKSLLSHLPNLLDSLQPLKQAEQELLACQVDYNEYTIFSYEDLTVEMERLSQLAQTRKSFIENQITARKSTNVPAELLEEFESAFRAFDKEQKNSLDLDELAGALGALGILEVNLDEINAAGDQVSFEEFIRFLTARSEDRLTGDKVRSCFRSAASSKTYLTELDLQRLDLPQQAIEFLQGHMHATELEQGVDHSEEVGQIAFDFQEFLDTFLEEEVELAGINSGATKEGGRASLGPRASLG